MTGTRPRIHLKAARALLVAGVAAVVVSACATTLPARTSADYSNLPAAQVQVAVADLASRYRSDPGNRELGIHYAAALRAAGQNAQAVTVMETLVGRYPGDASVSLAYAKALTADGRFEQALAVAENAANPVAPDWEVLSVRGAILDQMGEHALARQAYQQALLLAPGEAGLHANLGLSYAMTGGLDRAEAALRQAVALPGASSRVWQNLALVIGLQGRFTEAEQIYALHLPPDEVAATMTYIRGMLTEQSRWDAIRR